MFWKIFLRLCNEKDIKPNNVAKQLGIASGTVSGWKNKGQTPQDGNLIKIADYFGVSVDYLLGKESDLAEPPVTLYEESGRIHMIPIYETVSAGFGALAVNDIVDYRPHCFKVNQEAAESLFIRVRGDSMYPKIEDGDLILIHKQDSVDSGAIAVVLIDGEEGLVKKVIYGDSWLELQSINPMYMPRRFAGKEMSRVQILGKLRAIIHEEP